MMIPPRFGRSLFLCFALTSWLLAGWLAAAPMISEFSAINSGEFLVDEDGDSSDWIEISNPDDAAIDLTGFGLSDDQDQPLKWQMPAVILEPGGLLVVFASGKDRAVAGDELHTNFSLSGNGEYLGLADTKGAVVSEFDPEFPEQQRDISFGSGAGGVVGYLLVPTPGAPNGFALADLTSPPEFSAEHGYYTQPVVLAIAAPTGGSKVFYTTDGSPPTRLNGQEYSDPIVVGSTAVFRAVAVKPGAIPSQIVTRSFLFPADIKNQSRMSQLIAAAPEYADEIEADLAALPALSISVEDARFLGSSGIYTNFQDRGRGAEVPVSVEYFDPEGTEDSAGGFQIDAGLRIHGGQARFHEKKPMRLYFRSDYGDGRLDYPLFEGSRVQNFDRLVMRSCGHDGWAIDWGNGRNDLTETATYMRDEFMRRSEQAMGLLSPHGKFVHVFINGEYWGMYDLHERADSAFFAAHEGGDESDWDVIEGGGFLAEGDQTAWNDLLGLGITGVTDAAGYQEMEGMLEMDAYVDSLISRMWSGDHDWLGPTFFGAFSTGVNNRNWFSGRRSRGADDEPFHFFSWDAEISLGNDRFTGSGNHQLNVDLTRIDTPNSPSVPYTGMMGYEEFRIKFADRIYEHLFNDGELTTEKTRDLWDDLSDLVRNPVVAESARWGNIHGGVPLRRDVEWEEERRWVRDTYLLGRTRTVLNQFKARNLYPNVEPPLFTSFEGGSYPEAVSISLGVPAGQAGQIFYTLDGTDPRRGATSEVRVLLPQFAPARVLIPSVANGGSELGDNWRRQSDPVGIENWIEGEGAVGFETQGQDYRSLLSVDVEEEMFGLNASVYLRTEFDLPDQASVDSIASLKLRMKFDDGFAAFLNGEPIASENAPANLEWFSASTGTQADAAAVIFKEFDITASIGSLRVGRNVLAIQGMNSSTTSSDLLLVPSIVASGVETAAGVSEIATQYTSAFDLASNATVRTRFLSAGGEWSALREEVFSIGNRRATVGDLVISEFSYRPLGPQGALEGAVADSRGHFEFVELVNVSGGALDIGGVAFDDGIDFVFPQGTGLAEDARVLIVSDVAAFRVRYPAVPVDQIAGIFANDTSLSNGGERVVLLDAMRATIIDFEYDDKAPWPTAPDGGGPTLVLIDPYGSADPSIPTNWRASRTTHGAPGGDEDEIDLDMDGLPDDWERQWFGDLSQNAPGDADDDGLDNGDEFGRGTNPVSTDTDADGLLDGEEVAAETDPLNRDTDGDQLTDGEEAVFNSNPLLPDTDGDGLTDGEEAIFSMTDPNDRDSDDDGSGDFSERQRGSDPNDPGSVPFARESDFLIYSPMDPEGIHSGLVENLVGLNQGVIVGGEVEVVSGVESGLKGNALGGAVKLVPGRALNYGEVGDPGAGSLTVMLWYRSEGGKDPARELISKGDAWRLMSEGGEIRLQSDQFSELTLDTPSPGNWHQLAFVIDSETRLARLFIDGSDQDLTQVIPDGAFFDSPEPLWIGSGKGDGIVLDEVCVWDFPLNEVQIKQLSDGVADGLAAVDVIDRDNLREHDQGDPDGDGLSSGDEFLLGTDPERGDTDGDGANDAEEIAAGSDPNDPASMPGMSDVGRDFLLYSSFDIETVTGDGSGARVFDLTVPSENGTIGGDVMSVPGRVGEGARITGGLVSYGDFHDPGTGSYSASVWFQLDRMSPGVAQRIVGKGSLDGEGGSTGWQILVIGDEVAVIGGAVGGTEWYVRGMPAGQSKLRIGGWNHAALTIDRTPGSGRARLFVNGAEVDDSSAPESRIADDLPIESIGRLVTHRGDEALDNTNFDGAIDELAIWGRAISPSEVAAIYRGGIVGAGANDLAGLGGQDPDFAASPGEISIVLNPGEAGTADVNLSNIGSGQANWFAQLLFDSDVTLEEALAQIDGNAMGLLDTIPLRYAFTEGVVGADIRDGELDMYDTGNILSTDRSSQIDYSDGVIVDSEEFGNSGRYFTRKIDGGLFVLGANLDDVDYFEIYGGLGADGAGTADGTVLTVERGSRRFTGFVKRVYDGLDGFSQLFDPSVNHLVIIEDNGLATQSFSSNTDLDQHRVSGLIGVTRLYYLLYSSVDGVRIDDADTQAIFENFIDTVGVAPGWAEIGSDSGQIEADGEFDLQVGFDPGMLQPGVQEAVLQVFSNDPDSGRNEILVRLRINAPPTSLGVFEIEGDEDSTPVFIEVEELFDDDGEAEGESLAFELVSISNPNLIDLELTEIVEDEMTLAFVPDAFGTATVRVRATDPQGLSTIGIISVDIDGVNDLPEMTSPFEAQYDEDSGPLALSLREFFNDVEDGRDGLAFAIAGAPSSGGILGPLFLDVGVLSFGLIPDANGIALVPVEVSDTDGGARQFTLRVEILPVADPPQTVDSIPGVRAGEAAQDSVVKLANFFRERDAGDTLTYQILENSNPELFASLSIDPKSGDLTISYAPFVSGSAEITVRATDSTGLFADQVFTVVLPEIDQPEISVDASLRLNRQTGLWEQTVTITNNALRDIGAVRLLIGGFPAGVDVHNASDRLADGRAEVIYNRTLPAGESVSLLVEYYSADRGVDFDPQVEVEVSLRQSATTEGEVFAIDRMLLIGDGSVLIEFPSVAGDLYLVQYSTDMKLWKDALVRIRAGGTRVQWIDRGAPVTDSSPAEGSGRFYRVLRLAAEPK